MEKKIIIALDCDREKAEYLVNLLKGKVDIFKIGPVLFVKEGRDIIKWINSKGGRVFLDLKLHDIPNTVKNTIKNLRDLDLYSLSIHISGGINMLYAAKEVAGDIRIWGISILTSIDRLEYSKIGFRYSLEHQVLHLTRIASECAIDGVVVSPQELLYVKKFVNGIDFITPSIRLENSSDDQKRYMTPVQAVKYGADYLVIGRPVVEAKDPLSVVDKIIEDIKNGCNEDPSR